MDKKQTESPDNVKVRKIATGYCYNYGMGNVNLREMLFDTYKETDKETGKDEE